MTDDDDRIDNNTVEPPKSNHSECEDLLSRLREVGADEKWTTGVFFQEHIHSL